MKDDQIDGTSDANNFSGKSTPKSAVGATAAERMSTQFFGLAPNQAVSSSSTTFDEVQQVQQCVASQAVSAACAAAAQPFLADTWWPNYEWTVCVCPSCGFHLGWYFQSGNIQSKLHKSFFGLVLDYLISEEYVDLLTWVP
ncbi:unnamed protein product [Brugia pahangi]|uniref:CULT domain-containing protein n=1 Tax=Brugia pahangi TaxID=6280 RepID=A0A0N4T6M7_BRUPA|nr:unnamed protein product [Brugia pahangi]